MVSVQGCKKKQVAETDAAVVKEEGSSDLLAMRDADESDDEVSESVEIEGSNGASATETQPEANGAEASPRSESAARPAPPVTSGQNSNQGSTQGSTQSTSASSPAGTYAAQVNNEFRNLFKEEMKKAAGDQITDEMMAQMLTMMEQQISGMRLVLNPGGDFVMNLGIAGEVKGNWTVSGDTVTMIAEKFVDRTGGSPVEQQATGEQRQPQTAKWDKSASTLIVNQEGMTLIFKKV